MPNEARWYDAMGGLGLEVRRYAPSEDDDGWRIVGLIAFIRHGAWSRVKRYEVRINRHEETRTNATCYTLEKAKAELLRLCGIDPSDVVHHAD
jgi:hypothetical protein